MGGREGSVFVAEPKIQKSEWELCLKGFVLVVACWVLCETRGPVLVGDESGRSMG